MRQHAFLAVLAAAMLSLAIAGGDGGYGVDPNGGISANGCHLDPNGCPGSGATDSGPGMDPNG